MQRDGSGPRDRAADDSAECERPFAWSLPRSERDKFAQETAGALMRKRREAERIEYLRYMIHHQRLPTRLVRLTLSYLPYARLLDLQRAEPALLSCDHLVTADVANLCIWRDSLSVLPGATSDALTASKLLMRVYDHLELLQRRALDADERDPRKYSPVIPGHALPPPETTSSGSLAVVPSLEEFKRRLDAFTNGQLRHLNWDNLFLGTPTTHAPNTRHSWRCDSQTTQPEGAWWRAYCPRPMWTPRCGARATSTCGSWDSTPTRPAPRSPNALAIAGIRI
jgi:hypothetical protein